MKSVFGDSREIAPEQDLYALERKRIQEGSELPSILWSRHLRLAVLGIAFADGVRAPF